jgi:hypothetical protein
VRQPDQVEQIPAEVDDQDGERLGPMAGGQPMGDQSQQAGLAAFGVAEHEQVRRALEQVQPDQLQPMLLDRKRQARRLVRAGIRQRLLPQQRWQ